MIIWFDLVLQIVLNAIFNSSVSMAFLRHQRMFIFVVGIFNYIYIFAPVNICNKTNELQWNVPQMSIIIIYNSTWSILIQQIRIKLSGNNLTQKHKRKTPSQAFTRSKQINRIGRNLKFCETVHYSSTPASTHDGDDTSQHSYGPLLTS